MPQRVTIAEAIKLTGKSEKFYANPNKSVLLSLVIPTDC